MERNWKPLLVLVLFVLAFFGLLKIFWQTPMFALGSISLVLTVLAGTNFVANNLQKLVLKNGGKPIDIWCVCSIVIAVVSILFAWHFDYARSDESIYYCILIAFLTVIVLIDMKLGNKKQNKPQVEIYDIHDENGEITFKAKINKKAP